jgi:hypothetical protein
LTRGRALGESGGIRGHHTIFEVVLDAGGVSPVDLEHGTIGASGGSGRRAPRDSTWEPATADVLSRGRLPRLFGIARGVVRAPRFDRGHHTIFEVVLDVGA